MGNLRIQAENRTVKGKGAARVLRRDGRVPAILYGPSVDPTSVSVSARELEGVLKKSGGGHELYDMAVGSAVEDTQTVMIKEIQTHPLSGKVLHIDFYKIDMQRPISVWVPVVAKGKSAGVERGGMLQIIRRELEVRCLPAKIPASIEIDVTDLDVGDSFHVHDIPTSGNFEIPAEVNFTVLTIVGTRVEKDEVSDEEEETAESGE